MTLLVDAGDTALRWVRLEGGVVATRGTVEHLGVEPADWQAALAAAVDAPRRVVIASAAGSAVDVRLRDLVRRQWQIEAEFPVAPAGALGLRNACADPAMLGSHRWLGMLAAWRRAAGALVVLNIGIVLIADLVDVSGMHRGGCRIPGTRLMREALHAQTSGVAAAAMLDPEAVVDGFGVNTAGAVAQGARLALAAVGEQATAALRSAADIKPTVYVTGSAAEEIIPLLRQAVIAAPDLVLDGLALLIATESA